MAILRTAYVAIRPDTSKFDTELKQQIRKIDASKDGDRIGKSLGGGMSKGLAGAGNFAKLAATMSARFVAMGSAAASAGSGIVSFGAAIAPAAGALVALPAAMLAVKAASGVVKIATAGVGEAISAGITGTAKEAAKALEALPPGAREFAKQIIALKPQIESLKASVSNRFFLPLQDDVKNTASIYLPMLRKEMSDLAGPLGGLAEQVLESARSANAYQGVQALFRNTGLAVINLRGAIDPLVQAFGSLLQATAPILPRLASGFAGMAEKVGTYVQQASESGQVNALFENAVVVLKDLGAILGNIGSAIGSVFSAASGAGTGLLENIKLLTGQFATFLKSVEGQEALKSLFAALGAIGAVMRDVLAAVLPIVAKAFTALAPVIPPIVKAVGDLAIALAPIIGVAADLAVQIGGILGKALKTLVPILIPIVEMVIQFAGELIDKLLPAIMPIIDQVLEFAGVLGATLLKVLRAVMPVLSTLIDVIVDLLPAIMPLVEAVLDLVAAFLPLLPPIVGLAAALAQKLLPILVPIIAKIAEWATKIVTMLIPVVQDLVKWFTTKLGPTLSDLGKKFSEIWKTIWTAVKTAWENYIKPAVQALVDFFNKVIAPVVKWLYNNIFKPMFEAIGAIVKAAWVIIQIALAALKLYFEKVVAPVIRWLYNTIFKPIFEAIAKVVKWAWENVIKPAWDALKKAFDVVGTALKNVWEKTIKPMFEKFGGFLKNTVAPAFEKGTEAIGKAWDKVKETAKKPIVFVIDKVINPLIGGINDAAAFLKVSGRIPKIPPLAKGGLVDQALARGGQIPGAPVFGRDNKLGLGPNGLLALGSGEFVTNTRSTLANLPLMHAINKKRGKVGHEDVDPYLDGYATGGMVGDGIGDFFKKVINGAKGVGSFVTDPKGALKKLADGFLNQVPAAGIISDMARGMINRIVTGAGDWLSSKVGGLLGGPGSSVGIGGGGMSGGYRAMQAAISRRFPGLGMISGFRPGAITVGGNRSYHGMGRAVDYPPNRALAAWIKGTYGAKTKELITPWHDLNLHNGRPHIYTGRVWSTHNFAGGNAHVHWAMKNGGLVGRRSGAMPFGSYDSGGYLPTGFSIAHNGTGRPEPVGHHLGGDRTEELLEQIVAGLQSVGPDVASAMSGATRRTVQQARALGTAGRPS